MKLTVHRAALLKVLNNVARIVERKSTIPILTNLKLVADGSTLSITGTDLDVEAAGHCDAAIETPGAITVPAAMLHDITRKVVDGDVRLELTGATLTLRAGRSRFTLQTQPAEDFPDLAIGEMSHTFHLTGKELMGLLENAQFAISTEETRYYLNGIYLHTVESANAVLRAVATDGHRLARIEMEMPDGAGGMPGVIVPRKAIAEIVRLLKEHSDDTHGPVTISLSGAKIRLGLAGIVLISKLIDGTFPDYQRVIPQGNDKALVVETATLIAAVDRVATIATASGSAIRVEMDDGKVTLTLRDQSTNGEATEEVEADYDSEALAIGFNAKYLAELLAHTGGDTTLIKFSDAGSPTIFQSREGAPALFVLMPMRV